MAKTAVEWLVNHWKKLQSEGEKMSWQQIIDITEAAKQMEREQIIKSNRDGVDMYLDKKPFITGDQYYTQIYGKQNEDLTFKKKSQWTKVDKKQQ